MAIIEGHKCLKNNDGLGAKYQDKKYGKGNRIANQGKGQYNCTVCSEEIPEHLVHIVWGR